MHSSKHLLPHPPPPKKQGRKENGKTQRLREKTKKEIRTELLPGQIEPD